MYTASPIQVVKGLQRCSIIFFISRTYAGLFVQQKQTFHQQNYKFSVLLTGNSHSNNAVFLLSYNITNFKRKEMA